MVLEFPCRVVGKWPLAGPDEDSKGAQEATKMHIPYAVDGGTSEGGWAWRICAKSTLRSILKVAALGPPS